MGKKTLAETPYLRFVDEDTWGYVERVNASRVVTIVPITAKDELVLISQKRIPIGATSIEFPAGLVGDEPGKADEPILSAARRELLEESGYGNGRWYYLPRTSASPGLTNERVNFLLAEGVTAESAGGGVEDEDITVHVVPRKEALTWLLSQQSVGCVIATKVFAGLYFADRFVSSPTDPLFQAAST